MKVAVENTPSGKTIVAGLTHTDLQDVIALARHASEVGIRAGLLPLPLLFAKLLRHGAEFFKALDRASDLEIALYDNPVYTRTWLRAEELFTILDACPHMAGVKMTDHDLDKITALKKNRDVAVFSGDDVAAFRSLLLGVDGGMIHCALRFPRGLSSGGAFPGPRQSGRSFASVFRLNSRFHSSLRPGGRNFEHQGAAQGARHLPIRRSPLASLALYSRALARSDAGLRTMRQQLARTRQQPGRSGVKSGPRDSLRAL